MRWARALSPFELAGVPLRNRIFLPAHTTNFGRDFLPTPEHVAYLRERARGGVALVIVEPLRVHPTSLGRSGGLSGGDRRALDGLRRIVDAVRGEGAAVFCQITHAGRHGENAAERLAAWGPSAMPWVPGGEMPHAMTRADMDAVRDAYVETAGLALEAGFQGMEIHLGHGHLLHQFLSLAANNRPDDFGGSLDNRLRYPLEVLGAVTAAVKDAAVVGIRVSVDDLMPDGLNAAEQRQVVAAAVQVPGVAFVNASVAAYQWPSIGHHVADMSAPPHPYLAQTVALRQVIGTLPLLTANRYQTLDHAETALETGAIDMVGMNRAHMADPDLIAKATKGNETDIRPCVAGNFCIGQVALHRPISCMMNPRVGKEDIWTERPAPADSPRRVLVVGAGPAGMEAARVAALRGHEVEVWDAADAPGGKLSLAGTGHRRADLHKMRDWLVRQLGPAGVTLRMGQRATPDSIAAHGADAVVLATGAVPDTAADGQAISVEQALAMPRSGWSGKRVVIDDQAGSWATLSAAETLAAHGARVTVLCRPDSPLWDVTIYSRMTALERLAQAGVALRPATLVTGFGPGLVQTRHKYAGDTASLPFDRLIFSGRGTGAFALQSALEARGVAVHPVGDANAPRTLMEAMHDAQAIARKL
ncbi:MAG: FAD-dependent oxidoreductase [Gemmobacter sp.]|nr:FAD-dependent oxidoreductase [Gemmobacter sp.]